MATESKPVEFGTLAAPRVLKEMVAVAVQSQALTRTLDELRTRVETAGDLKNVRYAVLAAVLDTSELVARLVKLQIVVEGEED